MLIMLVNVGRTGTVCVITYQLEEPQLFLSRIFKVVNLWETCCKLVVITVVITVVNLSNGITAGRRGKINRKGAVGAGAARIKGAHEREVDEWIWSVTVSENDIGARRSI